MDEEEWVIPDDPVEIRKLIEKVDDIEYKGELIYQFRHHAIEKIPIMQCCDEQKKYPTMYWSLNYGIFNECMGSKEATGSWTSGLGNSELSNHYQTKLFHIDRDAYKKRPAAKFCTYCGTEAPKMVRKKRFPKYTHVQVEDSGYCKTCDERNMCCYCWPPEYAWEPEKQ